MLGTGSATARFVQRYDVNYDCWKTDASPKSIFSATGYTQFLEQGQPLDDSLETTFKGLEDQLQFVWPALDDAALWAETRFPEAVYHTLCFYCAYLWYLSPFAKAKAPAEFVRELDLNLQNGNWEYLRQRGIPEDEIQREKAEYEKGYKFVLEGENYLQLVFRDQFVRKCKEQAARFRFETKWTVYHSPVELAISDIALIEYPGGKEVTLYILPTSPNQVLIGQWSRGSPASYHSKDTIVYGATLTLEQAEYVLDIICASALKAVACRNKMDIRAIRERAKEKGVRFPRISNLGDVLSAGTKEFDKTKAPRLKPVSHDEFSKYVSSFIGPPQ